MLPSDYLAMMIVGVFFILLGLVLIWIGKREERVYYDSLLNRRDLREFLTGWPERPGLAAIKIGGRISLTVGLIVLIVGGIFYLSG